MPQITLHAEDISCQHCAMTIRRELKAVQGVTVSTWTPGKNVVLDYTDEVAAGGQGALEEIGYPASGGAPGADVLPPRRAWYIHGHTLPCARVARPHEANADARRSCRRPAGR